MTLVRSNPRNDAEGDTANNNGMKNTVYGFLEEGDLARRRIEGELGRSFNYENGGKRRSLESTKE